MLTITQNTEKTELLINAAYPYKDRIKSLTGAWWSQTDKTWRIPLSSLNELLSSFKGELYFKTPLWEILGRPAPDVSKRYKIDESIVLPKTKLPLYPYQVFGARFAIDRILKHNFMICADGVGLGKTAQAIATITWMVENKGCNHVLLIVKKSIKHQWQEEIDKFSFLLDTFKVVYTGDTKKKRIKAYTEACAAEKSVLITNYHNFLNDTNEIVNFKPDFVVVDEAHCVKTREGIINNNISSVTIGCPTMFLTGTPIMSRPEDIFGIISLSDPTYFDKTTKKEFQWKNFKEKYLVTSYNFGYEQTIGARHLDELRNKCQDIVIRRTENEVSVDMPETITKNTFIIPDDTQLKMIEAYCKEEDQVTADYVSLEGLFDEKSKEQKIKLENIKKGMQSVLQIISSDPGILIFSKSSMVKPYVKLLPYTYKRSPKTEVLINEVEEILEAGEKVIIFSRYVTVGKYIRSELEYSLNCQVLMYTGDENQEEREKNIDLFKNSYEHNVLIGTDAMAEGLNLAEARHVINYDLPDTDAIYTQRCGRVRRVSSAYKNIVVHNLITKNRISADIKKYSTIRNTRNLDGALIAADKAQSEVIKRLSNT